MRRLFLLFFLLFFSCVDEYLTIDYQQNSNNYNLKKLITIDQTNCVVDIDGNIYRTIIIGNQVWMAENLRTTRYRNGDDILNIQSYDIWMNITSGAYCWWKNDTTQKYIQGALYNGYAVIDNRQLAPTGWHIPTLTEWNILFDFVDKNKAATKLRSLDWWTMHCDGLTGFKGTNDFLFNALPSGYRIYNGYFGWGNQDNIVVRTDWWTNDTIVQVINNINLKTVGILYNQETIEYCGFGINYGFSIRCIRDLLATQAEIMSKSTKTSGDINNKYFDFKYNNNFK